MYFPGISSLSLHHGGQEAAQRDNQLSYLSDDGIHLLHAQGDDAREEGLEHLARLLDYHLQDLQKLFNHPAASAALMEDAFC